MKSILLITSLLMTSLCHCQSLSYEESNGKMAYFLAGKSIPAKKVQELLKPHQLASKKWQQANRKKIFGLGLIGAGCLIGIDGGLRHSSPTQACWSQIATGGTLGLVGLLITKGIKDKRKIAIRHYNAQKDIKSTSNVKLSPTLLRSSNNKMGKGIALQFNF